MNYDFFAQHPAKSKQDVKQLDTNMDSYSRILLLSQALLSRDKDKIRQENYKSELNKLVPASTKNLMASLGVDTPKQLGLTCLPLGSFFISFQFQLARPYISGDDEPLYIIDNPVAKEKVFKAPMVRSTGWKGALRSALRLKEGWGDENNHPDLLRLFGTINDNDTGKTGRLYFYPSFFDRVDLEVINPHDRKKKAGTVPIPIESVPIGTKGTFTLLYTPLDRIGKDETETRQQIFADLQLVTEGLQAMFTVYGFGAKTSSGFGVAELSGEGQLIVHYPDTKMQEPKPQEPMLPKDVHDFLADYPADYLDMKPKQLKEAGVPNALRKQTKEIKTLYQQYQQDHAQYQTEMAEWEAITATPPPKTTTRLFTSFTTLSETIANLRQTRGDA
ncbi:MAG: hypothetical protein M5U34_37210 [Chloroflexi bacterium]|nr:hypothetical protein [Chloroflexota bacterium]